MKLKHLFEYNLKSQDNSNTKQYEYIETENYIFLKLDKRQMYKIYDFHGLLSVEEANNYLNNMVVPSKINKDTLIDFFDKNNEYFTRINKKIDGYNLNDLKTIFNKNHMGYSDWDLCTSDIDLEYEMKHVLFNNVRDLDDVIEQGISFIKIPATKYEQTQLALKRKTYRLSDNEMSNEHLTGYYVITFIVIRK